MEVALATWRLETPKKQREMKLDTSLDQDDGGSSRWTYVTKTKIITGTPDDKLANVKKINENPRSDTQLIRAKTKESMMTY